MSTSWWFSPKLPFQLYIPVLAEALTLFSYPPSITGFGECIWTCTFPYVILCLSLKSVVVLTIFEEPNCRHLKGRDVSEVPLSWSVLDPWETAPPSCYVTHNSRTWSTVPRASPSLYLVPHTILSSIHQAPPHFWPSIICFPHNPISSALVSTFLWHSTFSENHASEKTLDLAQESLYFPASRPCPVCPRKRSGHSNVCPLPWFWPVNSTFLTVLPPCLPLWRWVKSWR